MRLTARQKRVLRWVGYPMLALVTFIMALHLTFPYERVEDKVVEFFSDKYDVTISDTSPTLLPGGIVFKGVALQTRPTKPDEKPTTIFIDEVEIDIGLLALIGGDVDVDVEARIADGVVRGNVVIGGDQIVARVATRALPMQDIPGLGEAIGLPVKGGLNVEGKLELPQKRWDKLDGLLTLSCSGCTMGDGKTRMKVKPRKTRSGRIRRPVFSEGPVVPELQLGNLMGKFTVESGRGKFEGFGADSSHGELKIYGGIRFARKLGDARFERGTCMRFKLSDELKREHKEFGNFPELMGAPPNDDGTSNVSIRGKVAEMRWKAAKLCDPDQRGRDSETKRPSITSRPKRPKRPNPPGRPLRNEPAAEKAETPDDVKQPATEDVEPRSGRDPRELRKPGGPNLSEAARRAGRNARRVRDDVRLPTGGDRDDTARPGDERDEEDDEGEEEEDEEDDREDDDREDDDRDIDEGGDERDDEEDDIE